MNDLATRLQPFGIDPASLRSFDSDGPELLPYATLLRARTATDDLTSIDGVYEWQNEPLMFLLDADRLGDDENRLTRIRRLLAMRGDAPYLGLVGHGRLDVYHISLDKAKPTEARIELTVPPSERAATFIHLANTRPGISATRTWISDVVLRLLTTSIDKLARETSAGNAVSLVGRALFTRFLADRSLLPPSRFPNPVGAFDDSNQARVTSDWLDDTFNGDFLPLTPKAIERLPSRAFKLLGDILRRAPEGQLYLGWEQRWDHLDFAHIPVGVLSQAYEHYLRRHAPRRQRQEGGYYTPRTIADLMVRTAFHAYSRRQRVDRARVLDAAVGAGVFLLTAFRELVSERWRFHGVRPDTRALRQILYEQITGFDTNEAALRFTALGLYLISIELDPAPEPVRKLRFRNLRGEVLHKVSEGLGSLGNDIGSEHESRYDIVVGNPPWTTGSKLREWPAVRATVARIARNRIGGTTAEGPAIPNEALDLPFLWRAMEWTTPGGQIALALHARLLFQQGDGMPDAREALFRALSITAIVNGAELRGTKVWPNISAPFCLVFATNQAPLPGAAFRFLSPHLEPSLNGVGTMRIDASNAKKVAVDEVITSPAFLKLMFRGSEADLRIYERIRSLDFPTFEEYWGQTFGVFRGRPRSAGNGYQKLRQSSRVRKNGDGLPGVSATYLHDLPELVPEAIDRLAVNLNRLRPFRLARIHDRRSRSLFLGPLLIVHKSPPADSARIEVAVADRDLVFNETYYGYSARNYTRGVQLVRYLALLLSSDVALWFALMTSGEFGFEREVVEKSTIDSLPIPIFDNLNSHDVADIDEVFLEVVNGTSTAWKRVNAFVAQQYGLKDRDIQVIEDTLRFSLPFAINRTRAQSPPDDDLARKFLDTLEGELRPWCERYGAVLELIPDDLITVSPWRSFRLYFSSNERSALAQPVDWSDILRTADHLSATEVTCRDVTGRSLWIGRLNQARYWSTTQAQLVAQRIIWDHMDLLTDQNSMGTNADGRSSVSR